MPKILLSLILTFLMAAPVWAADPVENAFVEKESIKARLITAEAEQDAQAIIEIVLDEGWHSYGDPPGDAGLPPRFDWTGSENAQDLSVTLPPTTPKVEMGEFKVNSYSGEIVIPVSFSRENETEKSDLKLNMTLMICKDICIPETFALEASIPAGSFN